MKRRFLGFSLMVVGLLSAGGLMETLHRTDWHHTQFLRPSRNPGLAVIVTAGPLLIGLGGWLQFVTGKPLREIEAACAPGARGCGMMAAVMLAVAVFLGVLIALGAGTGILRYESP